MLKINFTFLIPLSFFLLISTPSLKLIYSSELINIIAFLFLMLVLMSKFIFTNIKISRYKKKLIIIWCLFFGTVFLQIFNGFLIEEPVVFVKYIFLFLIVLSSILLASKSVLKPLTYMLVSWGLLISIWQFFIGIETSRELGQHYLTVSVPIVTAMVFFLVNVFWGNKNKYMKPIYLFLFLFCLFSLFSFYISRASLIFPLLIIIILFISYIFIGRYNLKDKSLKIFILFVLMGIISYFFSESFDMSQLDRLYSLFESTDEESRSGTYKHAISLILDKPILGYGTGSSTILFDPYPHNLLLEILIQGGLIGFVFFAILIKEYLSAGLEIIRFSIYDINKIGFLSISAFLFMQWNVSFDFTTSYIPIVTMFLIIVSTREYRINTDKENHVS